MMKMGFLERVAFAGVVMFFCLLLGSFAFESAGLLLDIGMESDSALVQVSSCLGALIMLLVCSVSVSLSIAAVLFAASEE